jgi:predicted nucleotidyltransferase
MTKDEIIKLLREHRADLERLDVKSLALFGSVARGEAGKNSDVDFLVEFSKPVGLFKFLDVKNYLESLLKCKVDLVTPDALKQQLRKNILAEAARAI